MDSNLLKGHLDLILLAILERGAMYGLEISKQAQTDTDGYFDLRVGSLYPALHRLEQAGAVEGEFRPAPRGGAPVKYYWLTEAARACCGANVRSFRCSVSTFSRWGAEEHLGADLAGPPGHEKCRRVAARLPVAFGLNPSSTTRSSKPIRRRV